MRIPKVTRPTLWERCKLLFTPGEWYDCGGCSLFVKRMGGTLYIMKKRGTLEL